MEIHAPHSPTRSVRDYLLHLVVITSGVLIALSLEGALEWFHHRALVREARQVLREESLVNRGKLESFLRELPEFEKQRSAVVRLVDDLLEKKALPDVSLAFNYSLRQLNSAAWKTAEATGALSYMPYAEVRRHAEIYGLQLRFEELQKELLKTIAIIGSIPPPNEATVRELEVLKQNLVASRGSVLLMKSIAEGWLAASGSHAPGEPAGG